MKLNLHLCCHPSFDQKNTISSNQCETFFDFFQTHHQKKRIIHQLVYTHLLQEGQQKDINIQSPASVKVKQIQLETPLRLHTRKKRNNALPDVLNEFDNKYFVPREQKHNEHKRR